jgi:hypothetical protein
MISLTTSPIEIMPTTLPASSTGRWRKPRHLFSGRERFLLCSSIAFRGLCPAQPSWSALKDSRNPLPRHRTAPMSPAKPASRCQCFDRLNGCYGVKTRSPFSKPHVRFCREQTSRRMRLCPRSADRVAKVASCRATNFSRKHETGNNLNRREFITLLGGAAPGTRVANPRIRRPP